MDAIPIHRRVNRWPKALLEHLQQSHSVSFPLPALALVAVPPRPQKRRRHPPPHRRVLVGDDTLKIATGSLPEPSELSSKQAQKGRAPPSICAPSDPPSNPIRAPLASA